MVILSEDILFTVYNPPEHIQQQQIYSSPSTTYSSWSSMPTMQAPTSTTIISPINCWSAASSPPPPHQISAQGTPNQSPTHQMYSQHSPPSVASITSLSYPSYYPQDIPTYQNPEYLVNPVLNQEVTYTQLGGDRSSSVIYKTDHMHGLNNGSSEYNNIKSECSGRSAQDDGGSPGTPRSEWMAQTHLTN